MSEISNINGKKVTKIKFKNEIYNVGGSDSSSVDILQNIINNRGGIGTPSVENLFVGYKGSNLDILSKCDFSKVTIMTRMFSGCSLLTTIPQIDTSSCTNMNEMFHGCTKLITIPLIDTSSCTNMETMFALCSSLTTIPQLNTSKVGYMNSMFQRCSSLTAVQLNTNSVGDMNYMFNGCSKLATIDLTCMDGIDTTYSSDHFAYDCYSLTKLIIRNMKTIPALHGNAFINCYHFDGTVNETYNPQGLKDGRIYVPDDKVEELKTASGWSRYADIIVPLSILVE